MTQLLKTAIVAVIAVSIQCISVHSWAFEAYQKAKWDLLGDAKTGWNMPFMFQAFDSRVQRQFNDRLCNAPLHSYRFGGFNKGKLAFYSQWMVSLKATYGSVWSSGKGETGDHKDGKHPSWYNQKLSYKTPLMLGNNYFEPCEWFDNAPKKFKFNLGTTNVIPAFRNPFVVGLGRGVQCEPSVTQITADILRDQINNANGEYAKHLPIDLETATYHDMIEAVKKMPKKVAKMIYDEIGDEILTAIGSATWEKDAGMWTVNPGNDIDNNDIDYVRQAFVTQAPLDSEQGKQTACIWAYCTASEQPCVLTVKYIYVSDLSPDKIATQKKDSFGFSGMDVIVLLCFSTEIVLVLWLLFLFTSFCITACCGGPHDEDKLLETAMKQQQLQSKSAANGRKGSPRKLITKQKSPRRVVRKQSPRKVVRKPSPRKPSPRKSPQKKPSPRKMVRKKP